MYQIAKLLIARLVISLPSQGRTCVREICGHASEYGTLVPQKYEFVAQARRCMKDGKTEVVRFRCTPQEKARVEELAELTKLSMSEAVLNAVYYTYSVYASTSKGLYDELVANEILTLVTTAFIRACIETGNEHVIPQVTERLFGRDESGGTIKMLLNATKEKDDADKEEPMK